MKKIVKKLFAGILIGSVVLTSVSFAATSTTTLSTTQTSATGSIITQGNGIGTLASSWSAGSDLYARAMKVIAYWPDSELANTKSNSSNPVNSIRVSLPSVDNGYYVKLTGTKATAGSGYLSNF